MKNNRGNAGLYVVCVLVGIGLGVLGTMMSNKAGGGGDDATVAEFNGRGIKASEAFANIKTRLFDLEDELYRTKEQAINDMLEQRILDAEAKKANMPVNALVEKETGGGVQAAVTDADVDAFLASKGLSLKDPRIRKEDVKQFLAYRKQFEKRQEFVARLKKTANLKVYLKEPSSPKLTASTEGYPSWGNVKAPVTIIEFSDFQCPFCSRAIPTLDKIKQVYGPDKVRLVFRDMPLPSHPKALPASIAAHCANEQGKFWEFHNKLFENQTKLDDTDIKSYAKALAMDEKRFAECFDGKKHTDVIEKSRKEAESLGIQATPSFVINGTLLQGAQPFDKFKEKIDRALAGK